MIIESISQMLLFSTPPIQNSILIPLRTTSIFQKTTHTQIIRHGLLKPFQSEQIQQLSITSLLKDIKIEKNEKNLNFHFVNYYWLIFKLKIFFFKKINGKSNLDLFVEKNAFQPIRSFSVRKFLRLYKKPKLLGQSQFRVFGGPRVLLGFQE